MKSLQKCSKLVLCCQRNRCTAFLCGLSELSLFQSGPQSKSDPTTEKKNRHRNVRKFDGKKRPNINFVQKKIPQKANFEERKKKQGKINFMQQQSTQQQIVTSTDSSVSLHTFIRPSS